MSRRLLTIMREEGPAALYKGFTPKVLRLAPGGGVLLLVVEVTLNFFRNGMLVSLPRSFIDHLLQLSVPLTYRPGHMYSYRSSSKSCTLIGHQ